MKKLNSSIRFSLLTLGILISAGLLFSACNKSDDDIPEVPVAALMAFNLAPDKPAVGLDLSGNSLTNVPLEYSGYTGAYQNIYTGSRTVEAFDATDNSHFTSASFDFEENKYYSAFIVGANNNYRTVIMHDNFDSLSAASGMAYIRYINAIPDSSSSNVTITANGTTAVNENAGFADVSDFIAVNPGEVMITINNQGNINVNRTISLEAKKAYTVLLIGIPEDTTSSAPVEIRYIENGTLTDDTSDDTSGH